MLLDGSSTIVLGATASLAAGLATALGAIPVLFMRGCSESRQRVTLAFAAGVMLAASFFSLIVPGVEVLKKGGMGAPGAAGIMALAVTFGAGAIAALNRFLTVDHLVIGPPGAPDPLARRVMLFVLAITLHNFPEGMAVGVSFGGGDLQQGISTAIGIGVQNVPEGLAVAASLVSIGYRRHQAFLGGLASGLVEPIGGLIGVTVVASVQTLLPWGLGAAGGAMIYVVTAEMIPLTQRDDRSGAAILSLMIGLVSMMFLDIALG